MVEPIEVNDPMHLEFRSGVNAVVLCLGEATEEMMEDTPQGTLLFPLSSDNFVHVTGKDHHQELTNWWVIVYDNNGVCCGVVGNADHFTEILPDDVSVVHVLYVSRVTVKDIIGEAPFYVSI